MKHLSPPPAFALITFAVFCSLLLIISGIVVTSHSSQHPTRQEAKFASSPTIPIVRVSSKPAKDIQQDERHLNIPQRIILTLTAFVIFPFLLLLFTSLVASMANPLFWLWLVLLGGWAVGFGLAYTAIWSLKSKRNRRRSILIGTLSIILSTFSIFQLLEIFLIIPFVAIAGQVLIGLLAISVIIETILLGRKFFKEEQNIKNQG
ncbi:MAG: hypothetical protein AAF587_06955 [Bacteroidota bacterium]